MIRSVVAAALMITVFETTPAAGPFQVRVATRGQDVATSAPLAVILTSPFDSDVAILMNPTSYYFGVYDAQGAPMQIAIQRNAATNTLRISFDDGLSNSAPVDGAK